jgi:hypothetical protein
MNRPQLVGVAFAIASAGIGTAGLLNSERLSPSSRFGELASLDVNQDGRISVSEWASAGRSQEALDALDADSNGYLDPAEITSRRGTPRKD